MHVQNAGAEVRVVEDSLTKQQSDQQQVGDTRRRKLKMKNATQRRQVLLWMKTVDSMIYCLRELKLKQTNKTQQAQQDKVTAMVPMQRCLCPLEAGRVRRPCAYVNACVGEDGEETVQYCHHIPCHCPYQSVNARE